MIEPDPFQRVQDVPVRAAPGAGLGVPGSGDDFIGRYRVEELNEALGGIPVDTDLTALTARVAALETSVAAINTLLSGLTQVEDDVCVSGVPMLRLILASAPY